MRQRFDAIGIHRSELIDVPQNAIELTRQTNQWDAAIIRKDRAAIEANMAEDFRQIDGDGDLENKLSFVEGIVSTKLVIDPYIVKDFEVRLHGERSNEPERVLVALDHVEESAAALGERSCEGALAAARSAREQQARARGPRAFQPRLDLREQRGTPDEASQVERLLLPHARERRVRPRGQRVE